MIPDAGTVDSFLTIMGALIGVLILAVLIIIWMDKRIENGCPSCAHCAQHRKSRADQALRDKEEYERRWGIRRFDDPEDDDPKNGPSS